MQNRCVFLDRDGVLNVERGEYTFKVDDFELVDGVAEALQNLKAQGFKLIVITNQAGISRGMYSRADMLQCHCKLMLETGGLIDAIYYSPYHPNITQSLSRKPGTLLFERAIAKFKIIPGESWMVGDQDRDLIPAKQLGIQTIFVGEEISPSARFLAKSLKAASEIILSHK